MRLILIATLALGACSDSNVYTLYTSEAGSPRKHVATFDRDAPEAENRTNCHMTGEVLAEHVQNRFRYWCERGHFKA